MSLITNFLSSHPLFSFFTMNQSLVLAQSQFLSSDSLLKIKRQTLVRNLKFRTPTSYSLPVVTAAQFNFVKDNYLQYLRRPFNFHNLKHYYSFVNPWKLALQRVWKVVNDGIEAGTNLVPTSIPRPAAKIAVSLATLAIGLFVLNSLVSTAFFVLGTMGLVYFIFIALNKDEGPRGGGGGGGSDPTASTEETLEEARRIMEKYK